MQNKYYTWVKNEAYGHTTYEMWTRGLIVIKCTHWFTFAGTHTCMYTHTPT